MEGKTPAREKLECPSIPTLERKLANLTRQRPVIGPAPRSAVLDKLAAFLPQMATENARLLQEMQDRPAAEFDIEHIEDGDGDTPYIEMDLACGILELRDDAALQAAERAMTGAGEMASTSDSDSDSDSDDSTSGSDDNEDGAEHESDDTERVAEPYIGNGRSSMASSQAIHDDGQDLASASQIGRAGARREGQAGARIASEERAPMAPGTIVGRRRKVSAARSKMIEELP